MPTRPKLLPRPCPLCGKETGGCQIILFNPELRDGTFRTIPYIRRGSCVILRISHGYSKTERTKGNKRKKIWHSFRILCGHRFPLIIGSGADSREIFSDELFSERGYTNCQSVSLPISDADFESYRTNGWPGLERRGKRSFR